jgi:hypothetical protein
MVSSGRITTQALTSGAAVAAAPCAEASIGKPSVSPVAAAAEPARKPRRETSSAIVIGSPSPAAGTRAAGADSIGSASARRFKIARGRPKSAPARPLGRRAAALAGFTRLRTTPSGATVAPQTERGGCRSRFPGRTA